MDFTFPIEYEDIEEALDEGKMPVIVFLPDDLIYGCNYTIKGWSPVCDKNTDVRAKAVMQIVQFTHQQAQKAWEKRHGAG